MKNQLFILKAIFIGIIFFGVAFTAIRTLYYGSFPEKQEYFFPIFIGTCIGGGAGLFRFRSQWNQAHLEKQIVKRTVELQERIDQQEKENAERRQAEEALRISEEKYRSLVQNVPDMIVELNEKAEIISINESFLDNFIYCPEEIIGQPFFNFIHPEDVEKITQVFLDAIDSKTHHETEPEIRIVDKDGTAYWFDFNVNMSFDGQGNFTRAFGAARDITSRKQAEVELQEKERRYRFLADNITDFLWITDLSLKRLSFLSLSINRLGEHAHDEIMSSNLDEMMSKESFQYARTILDEELRRENELNQKGNRTEEDLNRFGTHDLGFQRSDGTVFWTETVVKFQRDEHNNPVGLFGVTRDINERKQAEEEMQKLMSLIESSQDFIGLANLDGEMTFLSNAGLIMVGLDSVEDAKKLQVFDFVPESLKSKMSEVVMPVIKSNRRWIDQTRFENFRTGETFPVEVKMFPIAQSKSGGPTAIAIVGRDLTDYQKIEEQLRQSQKMESLGTFSGGIAHDFNNILGVIIGYTELVLDTMPDESDERGFQLEILRACDRATNLINQIQGFSKAQETIQTPLLVAPLIHEVLKMMRAVIPTSIEIRENITADCGYIMADATQIQQIIVNLINNAVYAMKKTGQILEISLTQVDSADCRIDKQQQTTGDCLKLTVKDDGIGMTNKVRDRIFEPFFTTKEVDEGTGLGLSIVHGIVKGYKGEIQVDSAPGKGCAISVLLPLIDGEFSEELELVETEYDGCANGHILVVDDEVELTKFYALALEKQGYEVTQANDGKSALQQFKDNPNLFDVVFTDQTMPNMTGTQMSQEILAARPDIPIILATGFMGTISETELNEINFSSFLAKPIKITTLLKSINKAQKMVRWADIRGINQSTS